MAKSYSLYQAVGMRRYGSLINIIRSDYEERFSAILVRAFFLSVVDVHAKFHPNGLWLK